MRLYRYEIIKEVKEVKKTQGQPNFVIVNGNIFFLRA